MFKECVTPNEEVRAMCDAHYRQGRADQKEEDNVFFNFEGAWELEKKKVRADAIDEFARAFIEEGKKIKYVRHLWIESTCKKIAEQLKEQKK